jgi:site-specific DNA-methyltransferase (adenine-specific)
MTSEVFNTDCLEYMRTLPDKAFQLAIADPPYGIGEDGKSNHSRGLLAKPSQWTPKEWDKQAMPTEFFDELRRISRHQIVWGANHFISRMPFDASCWIVWDKENGTTDFADCELAWTSFNTAVRLFRFMWNGMLQGDMKHKEERIHPTQKPVALYAWLLKNYAKPGDRIFDPMMGSQSSRIAAYKMGFDYVGCELDKEYFDKGCERFNRECKGEIVTKDGNIVKQMSLFDFQE